MRNKIPELGIALLTLVLLPACTTMRAPANEISLKEAVKQSVDALGYAYTQTDRGKHTWGLSPEEVTLTYHVTNNRTGSSELALDTTPGPSLPVKIGAKLGLTDVTERGNVIEIKFSRTPAK
jgi:hypothetical protein